MGRRRKSGEGAHLRGVLVVDKPHGPTSHDVVSAIRKRLDTGRVGHAGTLDPMATGVLVVAVGEGTKLVPYLTAEDKRYEATLAIGTATDSLDADGAVVGEGPPLSQDLEALRAIAARMVGVQQQRVPKVSAVRVDGERLHARARRGEDFEAPEREVELKALTIHEASPGSIRFELEASKGFYVRSFGRDLAERLGTVGHLSSLRRMASGAFTLADAVTLEAVSPAALLDPATAAGRAMATVVVDEAAAADLRMGRRVAAREPHEGPAALVHEGALIAIAEQREGAWQVLRGFTSDAGTGAE
jgi:tRNA pseudouridine55 synthase